MSNDNPEKPPETKSPPPQPRTPSGTQPRLSSSMSTPRVIATGQQPKVTPTPAAQRFNDTMAASDNPPPRGTGSGAAVKPSVETELVFKAATHPPRPSAVVAQLADTHDDRKATDIAPAAGGDAYVGSTVAERYKVIRKLGEGGMGVVYLAEHVFIEKRVALKVLSDDFARKADLVARFMQEAKAASKIGHENIVDITDFGETASGSVFFAMEFLDGMDLAGHIKAGGAMPFGRARYIMNQICRALGAAHAKGIIHRDMKPENVYLVTREGKPDFAKILDFGIAKMSSLDEGGSRLTRTGMIFGTPEYMSPEQAKGDKPDHRVDIYAAGCILYEMLTGDVPFHAETFMGVLTKHMFENPEPPSQRAPQAGIPHDVEQVVLKALAKDRDQRFQTMKEMAVALEACEGGDMALAWGNEPSGVMHREPSQSFKVQGGSMVGTAVAAPRATSQQAQAPKKRTGLYAAVAGGLLLIGGAAAILVTHKPPAPVEKPPIVAPPPVAVAPPLKTPEATTPPAPTSFTSSISTEPQGADVFNGDERLGVTPFNLTLPVSDKPVRIVLRKKGFKDATLDIVPNRPHDYVTELTAAAHVHTGGKPTAKPVSAAPQQPVAAPKQEPNAPKPAGKLRDLKDPFAN